MNKAIKTSLLSLIEGDIDKLMLDSSFKRRKNALVYARSIGSTKQKVEISFYMYHKILHIYPWLFIYYPEVNEAAYRLLVNHDIAAGRASMNFTIKQPILMHTNVQTWMFDDESKRSEIATQLEAFLKKYTIPMLDDLSSIDDYLSSYEMQDERIIRDDIQHIFTAIAYTLRGEYEKGYGVLTKRFRKMGRKIYADVFEYFENALKIS